MAKFLLHYQDTNIFDFLVRSCSPMQVISITYTYGRKRWGDGVMGRWGDGVMG
ncbi:MAG: hypothetical protein QQW96_08150 [Tychonema bourrellyi B0820]|nr:hypothetical protein [Tychonema bourrellyi B0820]